MQAIQHELQTAADTAQGGGLIDILARLCIVKGRPTSHYARLQESNAVILRRAFPFCRDRIADIEHDVIYYSPADDMQRWELAIGAFVQALAVEPEDAVADELASWLNLRYSYGFNWIKPPFVDPRRGKTITWLMNRANSGKLHFLEADLYDELNTQQDVSDKFTPLVAEIWARLGGKWFHRQRLGPLSLDDDCKVVSRPLTELELSCLNRLEGCLRDMCWTI